MARITQVKSARQRFATIPVIDPATGQQKLTPVMRTKRVHGEGGEVTTVQVQKTTKSGKPVFMKVTESDKTQPLPNYTCEACGVEIKVGDPYKHVTPKSGPYGGRTRRRCAKCPRWQTWELSNSLSAQIEEVTHNAEEAIDAAQVEHDVEGVRDAFRDAADAIREIASAKQEAADSMESGFGHPTSQSEELAEQASELENWADEIEGSDIPDFPEEPEGEMDCPDCGLAREDIEDECPTCEGEGQIEATEVTEEQVTGWEDAVTEAQSILGDCPV